MLNTLERGMLWHLQFAEQLYMLSILHPDDFAQKYHRQIYEAVCEASGFDVGAIEKAVGDDFRWLAYISETPYCGDARFLLGHLRRARAAREAQEFSAGPEPEKFIDKGREIQRMLSYTTNPTQDLLERLEHPPECLPTGFARLDGLCSGGGLESGSLNVIAARPGTGKTAFAVNVAKNVLSAGVPVHFVSLEMPDYAITQRLLQCFWGRNRDEIRAHAKDMLSLPAQFTVAEPGFRVDQVIGSMASNLQAELFVVDYYQLIQCRSSESRVSQLENISNRMKQFAKENNKIVLLVAQTNRDMEKDRSNRAPMMSDIKGSGALEQDAHIVGLMWDKNQKEADLQDANALLDQSVKSEPDLRLAVRKNRTGRVGQIFLEFDPLTMTITEKSDTTFDI